MASMDARCAPASKKLRDSEGLACSAPAYVPSQGLIYLDHNASTPVLKEVADAMIPFIYERFGNPSSSHAYGEDAKSALREARQHVADLLECEPDELIFLSGATESVNYALKGAAFTQRALMRGNHIIVSTVEHPAVLESVSFLQTLGFSITYLPVDQSGRVSVDDFKKEVTDQTILVSVMLANNEVGTIQPVAEIARIAKQINPHILIHTDASQAVSKIDCSVKRLGVDFLTVAGHKYHAPKGIGALYIRKGTPPLQKQIHGGCHEMNRRAGTENVMLAVGLGKASEIAKREFATRSVQLTTLRDRFEAKLKQFVQEHVPGVPVDTLIRINGNMEHRLPNTACVSFAGVKANELMDIIRHHVACSAGAACLDGIDLSRTIKAMDLPMNFAMGTLRFSMGVPTTVDDVDRAARIVADAFASLSPAIGGVEFTPGGIVLGPALRHHSPEYELRHKMRSSGDLRDTVMGDAAQLTSSSSQLSTGSSRVTDASH